MDPCPFVRILVGNLSLKFPMASKPSRSGIHPLSSPCFCKIKLQNFPHQLATVPLSPIENRTSAACFNLNSGDITKLSEKRFLSKKSSPCLKVEVYTGSSSGASCGLNNAKLLGRVLVPLDLRKVESKGFVFHNGWVSIGGNRKGSSAELFLNVRAEFDPRFMFQFDGAPECSPQVFQIQGNVRQAVFTCKFSFRNSGDRNLTSRSSMSEPSSTSRSWLPCSKTDENQHSKERKGWSITIHDLSGSPVAMASMVTPFVPSQNSDRVSRSNPGAWLILRPGNSTWKPWGRLEAWREHSGSDSLGYRFQLLPEATTSTTETTLASSTINTKHGGKFTIDITNSITPVNSPHSSIDFGSGSTSRPGSGSGSDFGFGILPYLIYRGFVMSSTVGKSSKPEVEIGVQHVTCTEDAAVFVALAAAMDLSMDACRLFSHKLRKELRQQ